MATAYFDCFAGAAGDMIVGALLDAGASLEALRSQLARLDLPGYSLRAEKVRRSGMGGTKFHVDIDQHDHDHDHDHGHDHGHHHHRGLSDIVGMIERAGLAPRVEDRAKRIFRRLAEAEAKVHQVDIEQVHFHEVGAVDSIVDVVGACVAMELLDIDRVLCSAIPVGSGTVKTAHGLLPVPAPATAELLTGAMIAGTVIAGEATTPTAAAILTTLAESFGSLPAMAVGAIGCGAGTRDGGPLPNLLRVLVGQADAIGTTDSVVELSANLDDCTGEVAGAVLTALLTAGALDAWATPIYMKKCRPAWMLCALCAPADVDEMERILFSQTGTLGIRRQSFTRSKLQRTFQAVETPFGPVRIKIGRRGGQVVTFKPEFADCLAAADSHHVPVRDVLGAAEQAYRLGQHSQDESH